MKKYVSCIVLVILCLVCAMFFYTGAVSKEKENPIPQNNEQTNQQPTESQNSNDEVKKVLSIEQNGTFRSEFFSDKNLRLEWTLLKYENDDKAYFSGELYLDSPTGTGGEYSGYINVGGRKEEFSFPSSKEKCILLVTVSHYFDVSKTNSLNIDAYFGMKILDANGVSLDGLTLNGTVFADETYKSMKNSTVLKVEHISKYPELPSGDEITCLAMILQYLKYDVDKCDLCDLYLEKGPVGFTSYFEANVGNPRNTYNSYGCYPPVIINSAEKYISANGGNFSAYDLTGVCCNELYKEVSLSNPVMVWVCDDFNSPPSVSRIWVVNGQTLNCKSNYACMLLTGYDFEKNTVTLSDPGGNTFTIDKNLFELRYSQMGSYAVVIK